MDTLVSIRVFCTVAELKSFTAAAERLGVSPAMTSKHVMHLEERLSARLLNRTSRHVSLTESGALSTSAAGWSILSTKASTSRFASPTLRIPA